VNGGRVYSLSRAPVQAGGWRLFSQKTGPSSEGKVDGGFLLRSPHSRGREGKEGEALSEALKKAL